MSNKVIKREELKELGRGSVHTELFMIQVKFVQIQCESEYPSL